MKKKQLIKKLIAKHTKKSKKFDRFILFLLVFGGLLAMLSVLKLSYRTIATEDIAEILPADKTIAYVEFSDFKRLKPEEKGQIFDLISQPFGLDLGEALNAFGTGRAALTYTNEDSTLTPLLVLEARSEKKALNYFESLLLENESFTILGDESNIYGFNSGQAFSFKLAAPYVFLSPKEALLSNLEVLEGESLSESEGFIETINNLPRRNWLFAYAKVKDIELSGDIALKNIIEPLKATVNHAALSVRRDHQGLHFNTFLNVDGQMLSLEEEEVGEKFAYRLTDYILDNDLAFYAGGTDLENEWQNTLESISNLNPAYGIILEGLLRAQIDKVFGQNVDLRDDLYPLFEGEYAFGFGKDDDHHKITLVLGHDDKAFAERKLEKMAQGFKFIAAKFAPKISRITLPDGTESVELVPDDSKIQTTNEKIEGYEVVCSEVPEKAVGFCYSVTDEIILITTSKEALLQSLNPDKETSRLLSENPSFRKSLANLSKVNDELSYVNFAELNEALAPFPSLSVLTPFFSQFDSSTYVKHYFSDGVSTEGYVLFK